MTINKAIEIADSVRPNPLVDVQKGAWIIGFENRLRREIGLEACELTYPNDGDVALLAEEEYGELYVLYLTAKIDLTLREYEGWNASMVVLNALVEDFKKQYLRDNLPQKMSHSGVWRGE